MRAPSSKNDMFRHVVFTLPLKLRIYVQLSLDFQLRVDKEIYCEGGNQVYKTVKSGYIILQEKRATTEKL